MLGVLKTRQQKIIGRAGFKIIRFDKNLEQDIIQNSTVQEVLKNGCTISFTEDDIVKENMTVITLKSCTLRPADKLPKYDTINKYHLTNFLINYGCFLEDDFDIDVFKTMDVIDLKAINEVHVEDINFDLCPLFYIQKQAMIKLGYGFKDILSNSQGIMYLLILNKKHSIKKDRVFWNKLSIYGGSNLRDLLFLKFDQNSLTRLSNYLSS